MCFSRVTLSAALVVVMKRNESCNLWTIIRSLFAVLSLAGHWSLILVVLMDVYPKLDTSFTRVALLYSVITVAVGIYRTFYAVFVVSS